MESLDPSLCGRDLCEISEYLRTLKNSITLQDMQRILKNAEKLHLETDYIESYVDDYFRNKAASMLKKDVELQANSGRCRTGLCSM